MKRTASKMRVHHRESPQGSPSGNRASAPIAQNLSNRESEPVRDERWQVWLPGDSAVHWLD
jgi:hypothetical protein